MKAGLYRHYKGGLYQVIGIAEHTETKERLVVYVSLSEMPGPRIRCRPQAMFEEYVLWHDGGWGDGGVPAARPRFMWVGDELPPEAAP